METWLKVSFGPMMSCGSVDTSVAPRWDGWVGVGAGEGREKDDEKEEPRASEVWKLMVAVRYGKVCLCPFGWFDDEMNDKLGLDELNHS